MSDIKALYPSTSTVALTITLASLASDATLLAGRQSTPVENTNDDLDHVLSGKLRVGSSTLTAGKSIEIWAFAPISIASGSPAYPDTVSTADANRSITSRRVLGSALKRIQTIVIDSTNSRDYYIASTGLASLFRMPVVPQFWGIWVVHDTGNAFDSTGSNFALHYERIQQQVG